MSGTPLLSRKPLGVWNPFPFPVWYPTPVPHPHHLAYSIASLFGHCCSYLASNCPLPPDLAPACPPSWYPIPCHPHYPQQLPSGPPAPAILSFSSHLALLVPTPCPSCPHYHHPNLDLLPPTHQISSPKIPTTHKGNFSFSEFPSFLIFISISPRVGSILSCMKIIYSSHMEKFPK